MAKYIINGGAKLQGRLSLSGNKNSAFPCIAAALLTDQPVTLTNMPNIRDVEVISQILQHIGVDVQHQDHSLTVQAKTITTTDLPEQLTSRLRGSILLAGALLSREGQVTFSHPGGDVIGKRAIDIHLGGFDQLGYDVDFDQQRYHLRHSHSHPHNQNPTTIFLRLPTVTGTENLILASVLHQGTTIIRNSAQEPHVDLCQLLIAMGANIEGTGTSTLTIKGVKQLHGTEFRLSPDYIEFGTYAVAAGITNGQITLQNIEGLDYLPMAWALQNMGVNLKVEQDSITASAADKLIAVPSLITNVWPGFPTDLMSVMIVLATQANGVSLMHDWLYESRMFFVDKLIAMGAHITIADPHRVVIYGPTKLAGKNLETPDIRAGIALVLAALIAKGTSIVNRAELIERGYEDVVEKLSGLGADIERVEDD